MDVETIRYIEETRRRLAKWERELLKPPGMLQNMSGAVQSRINRIIPEKLHETITSTVKGIVHTALFTAEYTPRHEPAKGITLRDSDERGEELRSFYKKLASAEGAGTGAGGLLLGLADFPILIGIKMKFLFELAHAYGYATKDMRERLFILHVFQLAFSAPDKKPALLRTVKRWEEETARFPSGPLLADQVDWRELQQQYRDTIDFRKMLQLIPGIGAVVGAWANYNLLDELGETGMNAYRFRRLDGSSSDHGGPPYY